MPMICSDCGSLKWKEDASGVETTFEFDFNGVHTIDSDIYGEVNTIHCGECNSENVWQFEEGYFTAHELANLIQKKGMDRFGYILQLAWKYRNKDKPMKYNPVLIMRKDDEIQDIAHDLKIVLPDEMDLDRVA